MAEDIETRSSFAWAGKGTEFALTFIEDTIAELTGLDEQSLMEIWPSSRVAPNLDRAKARLAEEMAKSKSPIFSYVYHSELVNIDGIRIPTENIVIVLRHGNGDSPLLVGLVRACDTCPVLRQIKGLCRNLDDAGRRLALRLINALAAA